ncbi:MAG: carboxypeptidase M32 [Verrucomicrobiae bacterium]|nr:carboxypeptidase M32 [Verrucomicrobiae bacterium]MCB1086145.1 carboxypeptidase M32 [Verrucomicrobiae bacterium]MCB1090000.1 carboxypeptidase M32 [Verrucomicrobiae bacterium]
MTAPDAYSKLIDLSRELQLLQDTEALLSWDQETQMPRDGVAWRAEQMAWLGGEIHRRFTRPEVGDWIATCEGAGHADDSDEDANVREWRHAYDRATKVPAELVEDFEKTRAIAKSAWAEARKASDFAAFSPHLEKLIDLSRRKADCWGYQTWTYDALLDEFERGANTGRLEALFDGLRPALVAIAAEAFEREPFDSKKLEGHYPVAQQQAFNREVAEAVGFDFHAGRIDTAVHPFCTGLGPRDTRLTTRYDESDFRSSLFGVLHEAGHGMYDQGLRGDCHGQPIAKAVSLGVHESQSRLWENHVGRSLAFWERWLPRAAAHFPHLAERTPEELYRAVNQAERSHIRVEADEVTYDLHIMLRFEMETAIFNGDLAIADIPSEWNRRFRDLVGLEVKHDAEGCLQDIHWSLGIFGYFPTYSLGNLNASHLMAAAFRQQPGIEAQLGAGDYSGLLGWMREKIHRPGSRYLPDDLIARAAGSPATPEAHLTHLRQRYLAS